MLAPTILLLAATTLSATLSASLLTSAPRTSPKRLIAKSDSLRDEGDFAGSAQALDEAYRQMSTDQRVGMLGRFVVVQASSDYQRAREETAEDSDEDMLRAQQLALLAAYFADLETARDSGVDTAEADAEEEALRALLPAEEPSSSFPAPGEEGYLRPEDYELPSHPSSDEADFAEHPDSPSKRQLRRASRKNRRQSTKTDKQPADLLGGVLLGGGLAAFLGGGALITLGALTPSRVADVRRKAIERYEYEDDEPLPANWLEHDVKELRQGQAVLVTGSILTAAGVAAVIWGSIRTHRARKGRLSFHPTSSPKQIAGHLSLRF